jgi:hypothetical protein
VEPSLKSWVWTSFTWQPDAEISGGRGELTTSDLQLEARWHSCLSPSARIRWRLFIEAVRYNWSDEETVLGDGAPIEDALTVRFAPLLRFSSCSGWGLDVGPIVRWSGVPDADFGDAITWGAQAAAVIPLGDKKLVLGAGFETRLEEDPEVFPVLDLEGPGGGRLSLEAHGGTYRLGYDVNDAFALGASLRRDWREYRLSDDDLVSGGVFRDEGWAVGLDVAWRPRSCVEARFGVWRSLEREIEIDDRHGDRVTDFHVRDAWALSFALAISL